MCEDIITDEFTLSACDMAADTDKVKHYVILAKTESGAFKFSRDGDTTILIGMLEVMKRGLVNGLCEAFDDKPGDGEELVDD